MAIKNTLIFVKIAIPRTEELSEGKLSMRNYQNQMKFNTQTICIGIDK